MKMKTIQWCFSAFALAFALAPVPATAQDILCVNDQCVGTSLFVVVENGQVTVETTSEEFSLTVVSDPIPDAPRIRSFTVNGASSLEVAGGTDVQLNFEWDLANVSSCRYENGDAQWRNGTWSPGSTGRTMTVNLDAGTTTTYRLDCSGGGQSVLSSVTVTAPAPEPDDDDGSLPQTCRKNTSADRNTNWNAEFGYTFPNPEYETDVPLFAPSGSKAVRFRTPKDVVAVGSIGNIYVAFNNPSLQRASISPCPGDFESDVPEECRWLGSSNSNSILWSVGDDFDDVCELKPDTVYYLNFGWTGECVRCEFQLRFGSRILD
jgi:hypothetical protein